ncbi:tyrosine recombinase XerC [Desulfotomaculum defluvii]
MAYLNEFLEFLHNEGKDPKTIQAYRTSIGQFLTWYEETTGTDNITEVKPIDVKEFLGYLKHTLSRSQATINKSTASLKTFFAYLSEQGVVSSNPMTRIKIQKIQPTDKLKNTDKWLTREEQSRFISYVELEKNDFKRLRNLAIIDLMLYCGLRVSEVVDLKLEDIKMNGNIDIVIREGKHGKYTIQTMLGKHSKNLRAWLKYRQSLTDSKYVDSPYLFASERAGQFSARGIQLMLDKYGQLANMDGISAHRFRHSFCKNLANAGISIETIRRLARHESIATTSIYIDPSHKEQLSALEKL